MTRCTTAVFAALALGLTVAAATAVAQSTHISMAPDKMHWGPAPAVLPPGAEISVLEGNPAAKGAVVLRLKLPANYDIPPHWHSMDERLTIISGTFRVGMGDKLDRQHSDTLPAGGFVSLPAKMHHYAWTSTPAVVQINLEGPFDIFYVHPSDDPQKRETKR